jgi:hypothetical protein
MTKKQQQQFVKMYAALHRIAKYYQTPDQLRKNSKGDFSLGFSECLEMAYENLQAEASQAIKGIRIKSILKQNTPATGK